MISIIDRNDNSNDIQCEVHLTLYDLIENLSISDAFDRTFESNGHAMPWRLEVEFMLKSDLVDWLVDRVYLQKRVVQKINTAFDEYNHKISMFRRRDQPIAIDHTMKSTHMVWHMTPDDAILFKLQFVG